MEKSKSGAKLTWYRMPSHRQPPWIVCGAVFVDDMVAYMIQAALQGW